MNEVIWFNK